MKNILKKCWRICFLTYAAIYLPWFFYLEKVITPSTENLHIIHSAIDSLIPFCEYFIIPYVIWFFYIAVSCVYMFFKGTNEEYLKFALSLVIGMSIAMLICTFFPNGLNLRPEIMPRNNAFSDAVAYLYSTDTPTNVFPSIHVYNSLAIHIALAKCKAMEKHRTIKTISLIICVLICMSTVFLKQHSVIDVLGACIMMAVLYVVLYVPNYKQLFQRAKNKEDELIQQN